MFGFGTIREKCPFCAGVLHSRSVSHYDGKVLSCGKETYCRKCKKVIPRHLSKSSVFVDVQLQRRELKHSDTKEFLRSNQLDPPTRIDGSLWAVYDLGDMGVIKYQAVDRTYRFEHVDDLTPLEFQSVAGLVDHLSGLLGR